MNNSEILYKEKLLETFKAFDMFCREHDINYYAAYGTLIGAVRHEGLIPWDDDVDVWMLPSDYEKFKSYKGNINNHYDIIDDRDENYWLFSLAKFVDTDTTLWETVHFPCITGVYIDIFPLYECKENEAIALRKEYDRTSYNLTYALAQHPYSQIISQLINRRFSLFLQYCKEKFYYSPRYSQLLVEYRKCVDTIKEARGDMYVSYDGLYREKEIFKKEWFLSKIRVKFGDFEISIPSSYDEILTKLYGDYMQLPPVEKRVSHHQHYFMDLDRRWTIDEIRAFKKQHR